MPTETQHKYQNWYLSIDANRKLDPSIQTYDGGGDVDDRVLLSADHLLLDADPLALEVGMSFEDVWKGK